MNSTHSNCYVCMPIHTVCVVYLHSTNNLMLLFIMSHRVGAVKVLSIAYFIAICMYWVEYRRFDYRAQNKITVSNRNWSVNATNSWIPWISRALDYFYRARICRCFRNKNKLYKMRTILRFSMDHIFFLFILDLHINRIEYNTRRGDRWNDSNRVGGGGWFRKDDTIRLTALNIKCQTIACEPLDALTLPHQCRHLCRPYHLDLRG